MTIEEKENDNNEYDNDEPQQVEAEAAASDAYGHESDEPQHMDADDTLTLEVGELDGKALRPINTEPSVGDVYGYDGVAPQPVDAETVANGTFERLEEGQGAVSAGRRAGAHLADDKDEELDKRTITLLAAGMLVALIVVVVFVVSRLNAPAQIEEPPEVPEQTVVAKDQGVTVRGYSYRLKEKGGKYQLMEESQTSGADPVSLGDLPGTPAGMVLYDGAIIIPENLKDGTWDIMAYTIGSGWSQLMDQEGKATTGKGELTGVELNSTTLLLTVGSEHVEVPLVW
jgi:hypothetical protein